MLANYSAPAQPVVGFDAMANIADLRGQTFGRLYALRRVKTPAGSKWYCFCCCGGRAVVPTGSLRNGTVRSCGCLRKEGNEERRKATERNRGGLESTTLSSDTSDTDERLESDEEIGDVLRSIGSLELR